MVGPFKKENRTPGNSSGHSGFRKWRRIFVRVAKFALLGIVGLSVILVSVFLIPATRGALLGLGVRLADGALPGTLTVEAARWPSLDHIVLRDVRWIADPVTASGDTLADLAEVDLVLDLKALGQKDARISSLRLDLRNVDIPAIIVVTGDTIASSIDDSLSSASEPAVIPFLRSGSLPGFPSAALSRLDLRGSRVRLDSLLTVRDFALSGALEARSGKPAAVTVDHAEARFLTTVRDTSGDHLWEVVLDHLGLGLTLEVAPDGTGGRSLVGATLDSLNIEYSPAADPALQEFWRSYGPGDLQASARIRKSGRGYDGHFDCDFQLPGSDGFRTWLPEDFPHDKFESVAGKLTVTGNYDAPLATGDVRLDLGPSPWLERGLLVGGAGAHVDSFLAQGIPQLSARLDTLALAMEGVSLDASGHLKPGSVGLDLTAHLNNPWLPGLFTGEFLADSALDVRIAAGVAGSLAQPEIDAEISGGFRQPGITVPSFDMTLLGDSRKVKAVLRADGGPAGEDIRFLATVPDSAGTQEWEVAIDRLGLGCTLEAPLDEAGGRPHVNAVLDSLNLVFTPTMNPSRPETRRSFGPVALNTSASVDKNGEEYSGHFDADFVLPGADQFQTWLPEDFPSDELESVTGSLAITGNYAAPMATGGVRLDLGASSWVQRGLLVGGAQADVDTLLAGGLRQLSVHLDTLALSLDGVSLDATGALRPDHLDLNLAAALTDARLIGLFTGDFLADSSLDLEVAAGVSGSLAEPEVEARVGGGFHSGDISIPSLDFSLQGDRRDVTAALWAGGGLEIEGTALDSLLAEVHGAMGDTGVLSAEFNLDVWEKKKYLGLGGAFEGDTLRVVRLDSLVLRGLGREMRTRGPAALTMGPGPREFALTGLDFSGDSGTVAAQGHWNKQSKGLDAEVDLLVAEELLQQLIPSPLWSIDGGVDLKLDASADLAGTLQEPEFVGQARARLLSEEGQESLGVDLGLVTTHGDEAALRVDFALSSADSVQLKAGLVWPGAVDSIAGIWTPDPHRELILTLPPQKLDLAAINRSLPSEVVLDGVFDIAAEVKAVLAKDETAEFDSTAVIPLQGSLEGSLNTPHLRVNLPNRSWVESTVGLTMTGSLADPNLTGKIEVTSGFIRIPEIPRHLHPVDGNSLLWALNDSLVSAADSAVIFLAPESVGPELDPSGPKTLPLMNLEILVTPDFRIIGYGADIKLGGKLQVARGFDEENIPGPSITGEIRVNDGSLKVMNRVFLVERGNIKFVETVPPDPNLDLMMETQTGGYLVRIMISGRASAPVIELTSEPDLSEEDIMAVLLFGQPMNDLDSDQRGRMKEENDPARELQKNLAGLAMAFGTKGLQDSMNESFGVDLVQMGSDSSGGSTLMVGKFITPDIILKYNQSLEQSGTYFMTLEYSLNRYFKIVTIYGQGEEDSGVEVKWFKRY